MIVWETEDDVTISLLEALGGICRVLGRRDFKAEPVQAVLALLRKDKEFRALSAAEFGDNLRRRCAKYFDLLYVPLREVARGHGYALAVHGSLERDIDLIAIPWTKEACDQEILAMAICARGAELNGGACFLAPHEDTKYFRSGSPYAKPHGRRQWTFHLGGGPYIDLCVVRPNLEADEDVYRRLLAGEWAE